MLKSVEIFLGLKNGTLQPSLLAISAISSSSVEINILLIKEELGKGIGDCDLTSIKYYNEPKSIWEMFGFEQEDLEQIGNPNTSRYWKNII